ncbi:MAG: hypothetical protein JWP11_2213 [Frankiales bacterium]|nr:hypothetical protein [Frankiales bacterium]
MSQYKPLSVRRGLRAELTPQDGVPETLRYPLRQWIEARFGFTSTSGVKMGLVTSVALAADVPLRAANSPWQVASAFLDVVEKDQDLFLDALDATLHFFDNSNARSVATLSELLSTGASAWTVAADGRSLQRRVDETANEAALRATAPDDAASAELREAWAQVYGVKPNASDAWDHAIKAVEEILVPIVVPKKEKATLGDVAGQLKAQPDLWALTLESSAASPTAVQTFEGMLRLMWPNPDRHGGGGATRTPSLEEAQAVVQLAVLVVQLARAGGFRRR